MCDLWNQIYHLQRRQENNFQLNRIKEETKMQTLKMWLPHSYIDPMWLRGNVKLTFFSFISCYNVILSSKHTWSVTSFMHVWEMLWSLMAAIRGCLYACSNQAPPLSRSSSMELQFPSRASASQSKRRSLDYSKEHLQLIFAILQRTL